MSPMLDLFSVNQERRKDTNLAPLHWVGLTFMGFISFYRVQGIFIIKPRQYTDSALQ